MNRKVAVDATSIREIRRTDAFTRDLNRLSRKHPDLINTVEDALKDYAAAGSASTSMRIPGLNKRPVFKERLPVDGKGKRGGVRLIYYCDDKLVLAIFVYTKSEQRNVHQKEIREALKAADLL